MTLIKWDEKFFSDTGSYIWVYNRGLLVSTNNRRSRSLIFKGFKKNRIKMHNDISLFKSNYKESK